MATFQEMLQQYVNLDYDVLVATGKKALCELIEPCKQVDPDNKGVLMMTSILLSAVGADGTLTALERSFLRDVLDLTDDAISNMIKMYDSKMVELVDNFTDKLSQSIKVNVVTLCLCIVSVDEKISREETAFIRKLLD